jgi:hypothetical protein
MSLRRPSRPCRSPRWHDGRLWFSNWGTRQIVAVDLDGNSEVVGEGPDGLGWATNWLRDGRLLITGQELIRVEPDGSRVRHADLGHISPVGWSEITVDGRGNVYVNTINFDFADFNEVLESGKALGKIALVTPDGEAREVADELAFPNGMVISPDNRSSSPPSPLLHASPPSTSMTTAPCRTGASGPTGSLPTAYASTGTAASGPRPRTPRTTAPGSARAKESRSGRQAGFSRFRATRGALEHFQRRWPIRDRRRP